MAYIHTSSFSLQNAISFTILTYFVSVLIIFYIQSVLKLKNNKHCIYSPFFSSSKCSLFHNFNVFVSCIIHILYIYTTNIGTEYFKHGIYSPSFPLQNAVCFIIPTYLVPVLFTFYTYLFNKYRYWIF